MFTYGPGLLWVSLFVIFVIGEIASLGITSIWFAGGALAAFIVSLITDIIWIQVVVFLLVSILLLAFTRPVVKKHFNSKNLAKTNVDAIIEECGIVKETIDNLNGTGVVNLNGLEWSAKAKDESLIIEPGTKVVVKEIKGVNVIVEPAK